MSSSLFVPAKGYIYLCIFKKCEEQSLQGQKCPKSSKKVFHLSLSSGVNSLGKLPVIMWRIVQPILPSYCLVILCSPYSMSAVLFPVSSSQASSFQKGSISLLIIVSLQKIPSLTSPIVEKMQNIEIVEMMSATIVTKVNFFLCFAMIQSIDEWIIPQSASSCNSDCGSLCAILLSYLQMIIMYLQRYFQINACLNLFYKYSCQLELGREIFDSTMQVVQQSLKNNILIFMLQQQSSPQQSRCLQCQKKQTMLQKFTELVHLLKKKNQKHNESKTKSSTQSQLNWVQANSNHTHAIIRFIVVTEKANFRTMECAFRMLREKTSHSSLPFIAEQAIIKYLPSKQASINVCEPVSRFPQTNSIQNSNPQPNFKPSSKFQYDLIEKLNSKTSPKLFYRKIFELTHENQALNLKLQRIEKDFQENVRRQEREIAKKRESLQGLVDQLSQKNEVIEDLKETIKLLQNKLGVKDDQFLHKLLEQDVQSLRSTIYKLENNNDKLNNQVLKVRAEKACLEKENKELLKTIETHKSQILELKESMFETDNEAQQNWLVKRELEIVSQKIASKMEKIKKMQKKFNEMNRAKDSIYTHPDQPTISKSDRKVEVTNNSLHKNEEDKYGSLQSKIEAVFSFLFNIECEDYQLHSADLFDEQQKELLLTHQHKFIAKIKSNHLKPIEPKHCLEQNLDMITLGDSLLQVFEQKPVQTQPKNKDKMKMIEFELQRNKFIQKISEVKEKQLHLRCVILQLLKSLDLKVVKKETQGIVTLLCDIFEYSEEERAALTQVKSKKFFGFI